MGETTLDYWRNPRQAIATRYKDNDMCYAFSGAGAASYIVKEIIKNYSKRGENFLPTDLWENKTLIDFGCGTGRITRCLALFFKEVFGYDPVRECIDLATTECLPITLSNLSYKTKILSTQVYDCGSCVNVLEHLSLEDQEALCLLMRRHVKPNGPIVVYYHRVVNYDMLLKHFGPEAVEGDKGFNSLNNRCIQNIYPLE